MRILIDENVPVQMLEMLRRLLPGHEVRHVSEIKWTGKKDLPLLPDAAKRGFEAFLTKDGRQLKDPSETAAIKKSGMHSHSVQPRPQGHDGPGSGHGRCDRRHASDRP
ncbi:DUF5615 family PIN-like protein [Streptomyces sp. ME18-1-4]|uniref:DUF5615 family PIN-like protein n=1 Tax=Streptomyces sp. ME18-1-4 TaxID=3028685 RepID=UPI0039F6D68E